MGRRKKKKGGRKRKSITRVVRKVKNLVSKKSTPVASTVVEKKKPTKVGKVIVKKVGPPLPKVDVITMENPPKLYFTSDISMKLELISSNVGYLEFSGIGFCDKLDDGKGWMVYDFVLMDIGSSGYTEIPVDMLMSEIYPRDDVANAKVWIHKHPVGNGKPGGHNWSHTDETTIQLEPLGGVPSIVKWSISAVRTPVGWVARFDNHEKRKVVHMEVDMGREYSDFAAHFNEINSKRFVAGHHSTAHQVHYGRPTGGAYEDVYHPRWGGRGGWDYWDDDQYVWDGAVNKNPYSDPKDDKDEPAQAEFDFSDHPYAEDQYHYKDIDGLFHDLGVAYEAAFNMARQRWPDLTNLEFSEFWKDDISYYSSKNDFSNHWFDYLEAVLYLTEFDNENELLMQLFKEKTNDSKQSTI